MITHTQAQTPQHASLVASPACATAATRYQHLREIEAEHLAIMARENLAGEWSADVRATVVAAREVVEGAREARAHFRAHVREFVLACRPAGEPLAQVLRKTRSLLQGLERAAHIRDDNGWFEAEVLEWRARL